MRARALVLAVAFALVVTAGAGSRSFGSAEPTLREECFSLELETPVDGSPQHIGLAKLSRTAVGDETLLEWDVFLATENVRMLHVERFASDGAKMVWRELSSGRGRTVLAELGHDSPTMRVIDWSTEREREDVHVEADALLPLAHLELVRRGELCDGVQRVFDPLARVLEPLTTATRFTAVPLERQDDGPDGIDGADAAGLDSWRLERDVETTRADGTHAWSARFCGDELMLYRWQAGGLVARRIQFEDYERELETLAPEVVESTAPVARVKSE